MKSKRKKQIGTLLTVCFIAMLPTTAYAGDINSAEQMVINYYNGTFTHNGKQYVATEAAKASAYNKLVADDVDLTTSQAKAAIRQASNQIEEGIAQGYLVEVVSDKNPDTQVPSTENGENPIDDTKNPADNEGNLNTEPPVQGDEGGHKEPDTPGLDDEPEKTEPDTEIVKPEKPVDLNELVEDVPEDKYVNIQTDVDGETDITPEQIDEVSQQSVTVEQYIEGELTSVTDEGTLLYKGSLPIKNTGYYNGTGNMVLLIMGILFTLTIVTAVVYVIRNRRDSMHKVD